MWRVVERRPSVGHAAMVLQTMVISISYLLAREAALAFHPLFLTGARGLLSALLFLLLGREKLFPLPRDPKIFFLAFIGVFLNQGLFNWGMAYTTPTTAALLYALVPSGVFLIGWLYLKQEKPTLYKFLALVAAYGGVILALWHNFHQVQPTWGTLLILGGVAFWALYLNLSKPLIGQLGAFRLTAYVMMVGGALHSLLLPAGMIFQNWDAATPIAWVGLGYLVVGTSATAYALLSFALKHLSPTQTALHINAQPLGTFILAASLGKETFTWQVLLSMGLLLLAFFLLQK
ncbi:MAG: DMT family transporter [Bacteroidia bacterium]